MDEDGNVWSVSFWGKDLVNIFVDFTDKDIQSIDFASFSKLKDISIFASPFQNDKLTDRSLAHIANNCRGLESVRISFAKATDKGVIQLVESQPSLNNLSFARCAISDKSMPVIGALKNLRFLTLDHTRITSKGLQYLKGSQQLRGLSIKGTKVSNHSLAAIAELKTLRFLDLNETDVTDDEIQKLRSLTDLYQLDVTSTRVTMQGVQKLQQQLPKLKVLK